MEFGGIAAAVEVVEKDVYVMICFGYGISEVQFMKNGEQRVVGSNCCESLEKLQVQKKTVFLSKVGSFEDQKDGSIFEEENE
ncbi:hypothetical protein C5167_043988 [Papaver somniferum]|uniref:Uncharacterized protein n=1 Tax=Papaver somniferum TaxID=3469 RepID=A0A4Y7L9Q5_PAPSO|nr:hypothetical protein C5167_043988 [Papaver somniferum]